MFVVDQVGIVWAINLDSGTKRTVLDVGDRLVELGVFGDNSFDEWGLLGLAFDPNYLSNGQFYTYSSEPVSGRADFSTFPVGLIANHQSLIIRWQVEEIADPQTIVASDSAQVLMRIDQPQFNHNGGALAFGADNYLYIALGGGGGADDNDGLDFLDLPNVGHGVAIVGGFVNTGENARQLCSLGGLLYRKLADNARWNRSSASINIIICARGKCIKFQKESLTSRFNRSYSQTESIIRIQFGL